MSTAHRANPQEFLDLTGAEPLFRKRLPGVPGRGPHAPTPAPLPLPRAQRHHHTHRAQNPRRDVGRLHDPDPGERPGARLPPGTLAAHDRLYSPENRGVRFSTNADVPSR